MFPRYLPPILGLFLSSGVLFGSQYPDADYQVTTGGIAQIRRNTDGSYVFTNENKQQDKAVKVATDGSFKAFGIDGVFTSGGQIISWPGIQWSSITGIFIVQSNGGQANITRSKNDTYKFVNEFGKEADGIAIQRDGNFTAYGIKGKVDVDGIQWPGNRWLRIQPRRPGAPIPNPGHRTALNLHLHCDDRDDNPIEGTDEIYLVGWSKPTNGSAKTFSFGPDDYRDGGPNERSRAYYAMINHPLSPGENVEGRLVIMEDDGNFGKVLEALPSVARNLPEGQPRDLGGIIAGFASALSKGEDDQVAGFKFKLTNKDGDVNLEVTPDGPAIAGLGSSHRLSAASGQVNFQQFHVKNGCDYKVALWLGAPELSECCLFPTVSTVRQHERHGP